MELRESEVKLIEAVNSIIEDEGFAKLGVNKIARVAGCDKVLIYRYFGGFEGLITAWAQRYDFYIQAYEMFISKVECIDTINLRQTVKDIIITQLHFTRSSKALQTLMVCEMSGDSRFGAITNLREKNGHKLQQILTNKLGLQVGDIAMYINVLVSSINSIVLSTAHYPFWNGFDFTLESSWTNYEEVLCDYVDMLFNKFEI